MKYLYTILIILAFGFGVSGAETYLVNGDFELGDKGWGPLPAGVRIDSFIGHEGTAAMVFEQMHSNSRDVTVTQEIFVRALGFYTLKGLVKCEQFSGAPLRIGVEFQQRKERLYAYERQLLGPTGTRGWHEVALDFTVPAEATTAKLFITLPAGATGTLWLDRMTLQEGDYPYQLALAYPLQGEIDSDNSTLRISIQRPGEKALAENLMHYTLQVHVQGRQLLRAAAPIVEIPLEMQFPSGSTIQITAELLERDNSRIAATLRERLKVRPQNVYPKKSPVTMLDSLRRTAFNGKPFLPVGLVAHTEKIDDVSHPLLVSLEQPKNILQTSDLKSFFEGASQSRPQQIALPLALLQGSSPGQPWENTSFHIDEQALKYFSEQSALLAWLLDDDTFAEKAALRKTLHEFDCHPLVRILPPGSEPSRFTAEADILLATFEAPGSAVPQAAILRARRSARELAETGLPCWALVKPSTTGENSLHTLSALTILLAMEGVRGFFFDPQLKNYCPDLENLLQLLEPYILSSIPPQEILPHKAKGEALAKEFTDQQGRKILLVVGGFQGKKTVADFTLPPDSKVVSHFGNTRRLRDGTWRFQGKGILYDLLELTGN